MNKLQQFEHEQVTRLSAANPVPDFRPGDTLRVHVKIKEVVKEKGKKDKGKETIRERVQAYEGICIARRNASINSSFTVRKISSGEGVERLFPLYSPLIKIERVRQGIVRRAKLYYLRQLQGKKARIAERKTYISKSSTPSNAPSSSGADGSIA